MELPQQEQVVEELGDLLAVMLVALVVVDLDLLEMDLLDL
jgi:hypothetical protein